MTYQNNIAATMPAATRKLRAVSASILRMIVSPLHVKDSGAMVFAKLGDPLELKDLEE
jgi:hypothetical protein